MRAEFSSATQPGLTRERGSLKVPRLRFGLVMCLLSTVVGCGDPDVLPRKKHTSNAPRDNQRMFDYVADNLQRLPDYGPQEILNQIVERLNEWSRGEAGSDKWQLDPLISTLPSDMQQGGLLQRLSTVRFDPFDGYFLREAVWLRDAAAMAVATSRQAGVPQYYDPDDDRQRAAALFDWTVRNIQLDADEPSSKRLPLRPWEMLLLGHGTAIERSWLFMLLARQQHLDVVLLATPDAKTPGQFRVWLPALLHQGNLYLFDMNLGVPVPGPKRKGIATLKEAAEDASVLTQLDVEGTGYPVRAADLKEVLALVEADVPYLSRRTKLVESHLTRERKMVLSVAPAKLAEQLKKSPHIGAARIWLWPYISAAERQLSNPAIQAELARQLAIVSTPLVKRQAKKVEEARKGEGVEGEHDPKLVVRERIFYPLWAARQRHFQGRFDPPEKKLANAAAGIAESDAAAESAKSLYLDARDAVDGLRALPAQEVPADRLAQFAAMRNYATYWLGLVNYEQGNFPVAAQFLETIIKAGAKDKFYPGALFNLARTCQAGGQTQRALELYEKPGISMPTGCRLRAQWLREQAGGNKKLPAEAKPSAAKIQPK